MRSLDTNVLVRYLAADDKKQLAVAEEIVEECMPNREPLFLSAIVLCELVWVLTRSYGQTWLPTIKFELRLTPSTFQNRSIPFWF